MGEYLRTAPLPVIAVYGAEEEKSEAAHLAFILEKTRLKALKFARDHALPLKKLVDRRYETYTPVTIFKRHWSAKHQEQIPGGLLVVYEAEMLTTANLNNAISLLERVRANVVTSGRSSLPIILVVICLSNETSPEEKVHYLAQLKKATNNSNHSLPVPQMIDRTTLRTPSSVTGQPPISLVSIFNKSDLDKELDSVQKFRNDVVSIIHEFYRLEIVRVKGHKRGDFRRAGAVALKARHEFKSAQYYEMRSLPVKALTHYQESYQALATLGNFWEEQETSEYSPIEIRSAAEIVHYRMSSLRIEAGEARLALSQIRLHLKSMTPLLEADASPADRDEYWEWLSRQHVLFAGLLSSSSSSGALTMSLGALDACERERCSAAYHLSRAALHAKKISKPDRALDLSERLLKGNIQKKKIHSRREASILISIAEERLRSGDEEGALRDFERAIDVFRKEEWHHLYVILLAKIDYLFRKKMRIPYTKRDFESQYIALYDANSKRKNDAIDFLISSDKLISIQSPIMDATVDDGGQRILLSSHFPRDLYLKQVHCLEEDGDFGSRLVAEFDMLVIPSQGSLLVECNETENLKYLTNSQFIILTFESFKWKMSIQNATPTIFALKRSDSISKKSNMEVMMKTENSLQELICNGFPPNFIGLVGESFPIEVSISNNNKNNTETTPCIFECECESNWIRIHASTIPGQFTIEISSSELLFTDQHKSYIHISAVNGSVIIAKKMIELSVVWPLKLGVIKKLGSLYKKYAMEVESCSIPILVKDSNMEVMDGCWSATERRSSLIDITNQENYKIDLFFKRNDNNLATPFWPLSIQLPQTLESKEEQEEKLDNLICEIVFSPLHPYLQLGQEVSMHMKVKYEHETDDSSQPCIVKMTAEVSDGFLAAGPDQISLKLFPSQNLETFWTLIPYQVGPQRFPGVWIEMIRGEEVLRKRRIESVDSFCVVLPHIEDIQNS